MQVSGVSMDTMRTGLDEGMADIAQQTGDQYDDGCDCIH